MQTKDLIALGIPNNKVILQEAFKFIRGYFEEGGSPDHLAPTLLVIINYPEEHRHIPLAQALLKPKFDLRSSPVPYKIWGDDLDPNAIQQMHTACKLPITVKGALMPDAHLGYGLPIGGVLATDNTVIPYAVGVDIACRMKLSVYNIPPDILTTRKDWLTDILQKETRFGINASFQQKRNHSVMDQDWSVSPVTENLKDKAWTQLGTSGSGNHFVEFGIYTTSNDELGLPEGSYLALLSHSGSRGVGAKVCDYYSKLARSSCYKLTEEYRHLAWLTMDSEAGQEYWNAMNLMGDYAAANHDVIHSHIAAALGETVVIDIENHHNFAWKETHNIDGLDREVIVHRKGATPAGTGVLGIIPGSMAAPGFVVRGKGVSDSLCSASHGAGRAMSRKQAIKTQTWENTNTQLEESGVSLISAGLDEVPNVYKDIHSVMNAQTDLVEVMGRFDPKLVKMSPAGDKAED